MTELSGDPVMNDPKPAASAPALVAPQKLRALAFTAVKLAILAKIGLVVAAAAVTAWTGQGEAVRELAHRVWVPGLMFSAAVMSIGPACLAARWRSFFPREARAPIGPLTVVLLVGSMLNYALPGPVGEFVGASMASKRFGLSAESAFAAGIHARFVGLGLSGLFALVLVESGLVPLPDGAGPWIRTATLIIGSGTMVLAVLSAFPKQFQQLANITTGRFLWFAKLHASISRFIAALGQIRDGGPMPYVRAAGWAIAGHGCIILGVWIAGWSMGAPPAWPGTVFTYAASTAGSIALFALPGGQLGWDAMFSSLLVGTAGVEVAVALAITLVVRLQQLVLIVVGAVALGRSGMESGPSAVNEG